MVDLPRRLAAVMFTDVVGYTAMMQEDEEATRLVRLRHREALEAAIAAHGGELVQYLGDGSLSTFPSAVRAVSAAVEVQHALRDEVPLRIGVHQGEIAFDDQGIYGDSVNVAARVMGMGTAGSVLVSGKAQDELKNQRDYTTASLGTFALKNVKHPLVLYAVEGEGLDVPTREEVIPSAEPLISPSQSRGVLRLLLTASVAAAIVVLMTGAPLSIAQGALSLPILVAFVGQQRVGRNRKPHRHSTQPIQLAASFEGGLYGGLVGGGLAGLVIALMYGFFVAPSDFSPVQLWRLSHVFLVGALAGVVWGAAITLAVLWLRHVGDRLMPLREAIGGVMGGVLGGVPVGVLTAWIFVPRGGPLLPSGILVPAAAAIWLGIVLGVLLYDYRGGQLRRMVPPLLGAAVVTAFAVTLTVRLFPYSYVASRFWIAPVETTGIAAGGAIVGAMGGAMLGVQVGTTLALSRLWSSVRDHASKAA